MFTIELRRKPVATRWSKVAPGSRSPANCSTVNTSKGLSSFRLRITQSRQGQMLRVRSFSNPFESA